MKIKNLFRVLVLVLLGLSFTNCHNNDELRIDQLTKNLDNRVIHLKPNQKLVDVDWRYLDVEDDIRIYYQLDLWILTRDMTPQDSAITYKYYVPEYDKDNTMTIIESKED
jgi:hypothetical protein